VLLAFAPVPGRGVAARRLRSSGRIIRPRSAVPLAEPGNGSAEALGIPRPTAAPARQSSRDTYANGRGSRSHAYAGWPNFRARSLEDRANPRHPMSPIMQVVAPAGETARFIVGQDPEGHWVAIEIHGRAGGGLCGGRDRPPARCRVAVGGAHRTAAVMPAAEPVSARPPNRAAGAWARRRARAGGSRRRSR
jgi:hypothetical protein